MPMAVAVATAAFLPQAPTGLSGVMVGEPPKTGPEPQPHFPQRQTLGVFPFLLCQSLQTWILACASLRWKPRELGWLLHKSIGEECFTLFRTG